MFWRWTRRRVCGAGVRLRLLRLDLSLPSPACDPTTTTTTTTTSFFFFFLPRLNASLKIPTSAESGTRFSLSPECLSQSGFFNSSPHRSLSGAGRDIAAREYNESLAEEQPSSSARESTTAEAFQSRWASSPPFTTTFSPPRAPVCVNHEVSEPIAASPVTSHSTFQPNKFHFNFEYVGFLAP